MDLDNITDIEVLREKLKQYLWRCDADFEGIIEGQYIKFTEGHYYECEELLVADDNGNALPLFMLPIECFPPF